MKPKSANPVTEMLHKTGNLLTKNLRRIVRLEQENSNHINLYSVGQYWAAFERSAFLLEQITHDQSEPFVLQFKGHPFPLVMRNIHYSHVNAMCHRHITSRRDCDYVQLCTLPIDADTYDLWHQNKVSKYQTPQR